MKKQRRLDVRKFSFSQTTINLLNTLSTECVQGVHVSSVNMFKKKIDKYLGRVTHRIRAGTLRIV